MTYCIKSLYYSHSAIYWFVVHSLSTEAEDGEKDNLGVCDDSG